MDAEAFATPSPTSIRRGITLPTKAQLLELVKVISSDYLDVAETLTKRIRDETYTLHT